METSLDLAGLHHVGLTLFFVALGAATVLVVLTCASHKSRGETR
jgi:hypothetical protein